ncbi:hypothetical protein MMC30_001661 [Trapelia coarctata]|nr:hypothetical protein [Trapelia coarctata]
MAIITYLFPALAIISTAAAATCSSSSTTTIVNPAGASALAACKTYSGDIELATGAAAEQGKVNLNGVKEIVGQLSYQDDNTVTTIEAGDLQSVGNLNFGNLTVLSAVNMPALGSVANMNFTGLGSLQSLGFGTPGILTAGNVLITNTILTNLKGLTGLTSVTGVSISNNPYLASIELDVTSIGSTGGDATGAIDIGANEVASGGQTINFPNLQTAVQITIRNASTIELPMLTNVSQNLGFYGNLVKNIALPNLTFAGGIVIVDNTQLTNISMPMLTTINGTNGTYQIANNTLLKAIDGFEDLTTVTGGLDFTGNFTDVKLPKLATVGGAMNVQTSAVFNCDPINALQNNQVVRGAVTCAGSQSNPGSSTSTSTSSSASSTTGAAAPLSIPSFVGGTSILAGLLQLLLSM